MRIVGNTAHNCVTDTVTPHTTWTWDSRELELGIFTSMISFTAQMGENWRPSVAMSSHRMSNEKLSHLVNRTDIGLLHLDNVQIDRLLCRLQGVLRMGTDGFSEERTMVNLAILCA